MDYTSDRVDGDDDDKEEELDDNLKDIDYSEHTSSLSSEESDEDALIEIDRGNDEHDEEALKSDRESE